MARLVPLIVASLLAMVACMIAVEPASAARISDVRGTKHNLSAAGTGTVKAPVGGESQICVFCHTPHAAESIPNAPLWNRRLSAATYTPYTSSSMEASVASPDGSAKLCLSCHDGTMAISSVNVLNGRANATIPLTGTATGGLMSSTDAATGFTRNLGVNLTNDHPISFTYNATLATNDGELRAPNGTLVGTRSAGVKPTLPLEGGKVQCITCHDPHLRETDTAKGPAKFLRLNRFQELAPIGSGFSEANDIMCLACHDKGGQLWAQSAHAQPSVANELYTTDAANRREFPTTAPGMPVWKAACLNCHDTHTVQGARRLLREGADASGGSGIEETCYQCHSGLTTTLTSVTSVPNIKDEFARTYRMPIKTSDQYFNGNTVERHDIGAGPGTGKDFVESATLLANRHVECTDCHNPHRVTKKQRFNADPTTADASGTHNHAGGHTNIASGVLRGISGVEPTEWAGVAFGNRATTFVVKSGDGGNSTDPNPPVGSAWLTREYQICLKCHSSHAYGNTPPDLGSSGGGTPSGTNGMARYTDQAMEFQAPTGHRGRPASTNNSGAAAGYSTNNHRSWHPVIGSTGRTHALRNTSISSWRAPWNADADVGSQTMYCSDCHGGNTAADSVVGTPAGPHGSGNPFILKGEWSQTTGAAGTGGQTANALCFKCHHPGTYLNGVSGGGSTGFNGGGRGNLHKYHNEKIGRLRCTWCHVAVPHGWKNKSLLVNLNDVGPEVTCRQQDADDLPTGSKCTVGQPMPAGTQMRNGPTGSGATSTTDWNNRGYTNGPYYLNAMLKITSFATSGNWSEGNCGSKGAPGNASTGRDWMRDSNESCETAP